MRASLMLVAAGAALAVLAGCGSSSKSTSTTTASGATTSTTAAASKSPYGAGSASAASAAAGGASAVAVTTKHAALGTVLAVGPKRMTVYLFEGDRGSASTCSGACMGVWPPVTTAGAATATGAAMASHLGTITRADGTKQVTYNGHPLYFFAKDKDQGDSYGQGVNSFGAGWYVVAPSGNKIDKS